MWGFFFAFTHSVDLQVDENDESKASPPLDPPPTRSPNRSPRMGRSVKARSMVIGKQINFQSYMPTIPSSQIPKSQTLPANMSTPIITVRCHGNHDLPKKKTRSVLFYCFPFTRDVFIFYLLPRFYIESDLLSGIFLLSFFPHIYIDVMCLYFLFSALSIIDMYMLASFLMQLNEVD